jgi:exopolysaccharide biosynthesis polyprenyl glycosylphosphotransferase
VDLQKIEEKPPSQTVQDRFPVIHNSKSPQQPGFLNRRLSLVSRFILDLALINAAFVLAYFMRYGLQLGAEVSESNQVPLSDYFISQLTFAVIFFVVLQFKGFYRLSRTVTLIDELGMIASAAAYAVLTMLAIIFLLRPLSISRLMYLYLFPLSIVLLGVSRYIARRIKHYRLLRGLGVKNVLVVGATDQATRIMQAIVETPSLGLHLAGYIDDETRFSEWIMPLRYRNGDTVPHLGSFEKIAALTTQLKIEEIVVALPANMHQTVNEVINLCHDNDIEFTLVPDIFELQINALDLQQLNGVPLIGIKDNRLTGWNYFVKRVVDFSLALFLMIVAAIPMLLIALAIKIESPGPIIFRQTRVGRTGRLFTFYKFRSMVNDADAKFTELLKYNETGGATFKMVNDPRLTKVGWFIRRCSLDELPQIFNILSGHMSFVGPRPGLEREVEKYQEWHHRRLEVTPGLTGLWQVSGRSKLTFDEMVRLDIYYAENWSLALDLKILLRTIPAVLKREGAY